MFDPILNNKMQRVLSRFKRVFPANLLGIRIPEVHELTSIPQREFKSMRRRYIFTLLGCGKCSGIVHGSRMAIDSNGWFLTSKTKQ